MIEVEKINTEMRRWKMKRYVLGATSTMFEVEKGGWVRYTDAEVAIAEARKQEAQEEREEMVRHIADVAVYKARSIDYRSALLDIIKIINSLGTAAARAKERIVRELANGREIFKWDGTGIEAVDWCIETVKAQSRPAQECICQRSDGEHYPTCKHHKEPKCTCGRVLRLWPNHDNNCPCYKTMVTTNSKSYEDRTIVVNIPPKPLVKPYIPMLNVPIEEKIDAIVLSVNALVDAVNELRRK